MPKLCRRHHDIRRESRAIDDRNLHRDRPLTSRRGDMHECPGELSFALVSVIVQCRWDLLLYHSSLTMISLMRTSKRETF
jgi:hypothetical protein